MADLKEVEQAFNSYIRPLTFPLAIKMLKSEEEIPEKTRRPFQQMKKKVAICQGIGMSRKLGWAVAMGKEDMQCALGAAPFGFFKNIEFYNEGNIAAGMFTASKEIGKKEEDLIDRFEYGQYSHVLVAPLNRTAFELITSGVRFLLHPWAGWVAQRLLRPSPRMNAVMSFPATATGFSE
jgi:uncharacterized protein (DUF169 family)